MSGAAHDVKGTAGGHAEDCTLRLEFLNNAATPAGAPLADVIETL
jgi:hypothetical protein